MDYTKIQEIPIELLLEHPENSNFMNAETARKLRRHIERTGRYEPLTVRPHPGEDGKFQVINGHNRLRVLRALNYQTANCVVWNLDDDQTRLYLATLNRLSGNEIPERRAALLDNLLQTFDLDELAALLPDDKKQIEELKRLSRLEPDEIITRTSGEEKLAIPVIMTFMVEEPDAKEANLALDLILSTYKEELSRSQALVHLARFYLGHYRPAIKESCVEKLES
jgi:ParB-like chromosome segregation protein Spo0J